MNLRSMWSIEMLAPVAMTLGVSLVLATVLLPVPPAVMDMMLTLNIAFSVVLVLAVLFSDTPLGLSAFPTLLLVATVLRLSLNIASTRLILVHGAAGTHAAGRVIEALGVVVVNQNFVVGLIVFMVIIAIQFVVINHGAVRISEVSARFILDAMPGKQMSIDADLNAGIIDEETARKRREDISKEAEFYGAMDGAIKFTQRDAIAGILIVAINIIGGFIVGIAQNGLGLVEAFETFTLLTIGDGLANAIPSLLVSVASALVTVRASAKATVGADVGRQLFRSPEPLFAAGILVAILALAPGLPMLSFGLLAAGLFYVAKRAKGQQLVDTQASLAPAAAGQLGPAPEQSPLERLVTVDRLALELGYELLPLIGNNEAGLPHRLKALRRELATTLGLVLPMVRIRDNPSVAPNGYGLMLKGTEVARGEIMMGHLLVVEAGMGRPLPPGVVTRDPAFNLPAVWVRESHRAQAEADGHMVIDPLTVLVTHFSEVVKTFGHELLGRQEVRALLDAVRETHPQVVEEATKHLSLGEVQKVLTSLLKERVPIRDLVTILETITDGAAANHRDPGYLTEIVRLNLRRHVIAPHLSDAGELYAVTTSPALERQLLAALSSDSEVEAPRPADLLKRIQEAFGAKAAAANPVLLTSPRTRNIVRALIEPYLPSIAVLSHGEVPPGVRVVSLGMVS